MEGRQSIAHVHHRDPSSVKLVDDVLRRYTNGTHEQPRLLLDDHVDELAQLALGVVVLQSGCQCKERSGVQETRICLAGAPADLREQEIDTERPILVCEVLLQDVNLRTGSLSASARSLSSQRDRPGTGAPLVCTRRRQ